jgi:hypothetical protein
MESSSTTILKFLEKPEDPGPTRKELMDLSNCRDMEILCNSEISGFWKNNSSFRVLDFLKVRSDQKAFKALYWKVFRIT